MIVQVLPLRRVCVWSSSGQRIAWVCLIMPGALLAKQFGSTRLFNRAGRPTRVRTAVSPAVSPAVSMLSQYWVPFFCFSQWARIANSAPLIYSSALAACPPSPTRFWFNSLVQFAASSSEVLFVSRIQLRFSLFFAVAHFPTITYPSLPLSTHTLLGLRYLASILVHNPALTQSFALFRWTCSFEPLLFLDYYLDQVRLQQSTACTESTLQSIQLAVCCFDYQVS